MKTHIKINRYHLSTQQLLKWKRLILSTAGKDVEKWALSLVEHINTTYFKRQFGSIDYNLRCTVYWSNSLKASQCRGLYKVFITQPCYKREHKINHPTRGTCLTTLGYIYIMKYHTAGKNIAQIHWYRMIFKINVIHAIKKAQKKNLLYFYKSIYAHKWTENSLRDPW